VLHLDADWFESTIICLNTLFEKVASGGVVIIDDYYTWDGCSRAVHEYLAKTQATERISMLGHVCYLRKN
jgi:O-methyltransferase